MLTMSIVEETDNTGDTFWSVVDDDGLCLACFEHWSDAQQFIRGC